MKMILTKAADDLPEEAFEAVKMMVEHPNKRCCSTPGFTVMRSGDRLAVLSGDSLSTIYEVDL